jgi:hypothetical protein
MSSSFHDSSKRNQTGHPSAHGVIKSAGWRITMNQTLELIAADDRLKGVWKVKVPGIYGKKGDPLPARLAKIVRPAAQSLQQVYSRIVAEGGHLYISDMFRSANDQQRAHEDWKSGRKSAYSPPSCSSVHEAARAIDIDAFDTGIGHKRVREILKSFGWVEITPSLTGSECWHYEFREPRWETYNAAHGYAAMARAMKEEIGNLVSLPQAKKREADTQWLQTALNTTLHLSLVVDGIYGEVTREAIKQFQQANGLQVDGVAGPITRQKLAELSGT